MVNTRHTVLQCSHLHTWSHRERYTVDMLSVLTCVCYFFMLSLSVPERTAGALFGYCFIIQISICWHIVIVKLHDPSRGPRVAGKCNWWKMLKSNTKTQCEKTALIIIIIIVIRNNHRMSDRVSQIHTHTCMPLARPKGEKHMKRHRCWNNKWKKK